MYVFNKTNPNKIVTAVIALAMTSLIGCGKTNNANPNFVGATAFNNGFSGQCLNSQLSQFNNGACGNYNYGNNPAFSNYPTANNFYRGYQSNFNSGFNSCPYGATPAFNPAMGLSCVQNSYLTGSNFAYLGWNASTFDFSLQAGVSINSNRYTYNPYNYQYNNYYPNSYHGANNNYYHGNSRPGAYFNAGVSAGAGISPYGAGIGFNAGISAGINFKGTSEKLDNGVLHSCAVSQKNCSSNLSCLSIAGGDAGLCELSK